MDSNSRNSNNKSQKLHNGQGQNLIDDLPDDVLQKILSAGILPKEVVATSVLSKRWKNQWIGLYKYEMKLDEREFENRQDFINFAEKLIVVCDQSKLKKVSLFVKVGKKFTRVSRWLRVFVNPTIEKLNLKLERVKKPLVLPTQFFTSENLLMFRLSIRQVIIFPSTINFENLVILTFKHVVFPNNHRTKKFFMGLPSLKELTLIECNWRKVGSLTINFEELKKLIIRDWDEVDVEEESDADDNDEDDDDEDDNEKEKEEDEDGEVVEEEDEDDHGKIEFIAPKLVVFSYDGDLINYFFLKKATSVTDASIEVHVPYNENLYTDYFVSKLIPNFFRVEKLSISDFALEVLHQVPGFGVSLQRFYHLTVLRVVSSSPMNLSCRGFHALLHCAPILQEIEFDVELANGVELNENDEIEMYALPPCFGTTLKIIKIQEFTGAADQLRAIKFLLEKVPVLDTFYIHTNEYHFDSPEAKEQINELYLQILSFPKASLDCIINLE